MIAQLMDLRSYRCWLWWAYWVIWGDLWILIDLDRSHCDINTKPLIPNLINKDTRWGYWETFKNFNFIIFISISLHVRIMATTSSPNGHTQLEWQKFIHYDCNQQRRGGCGLRFFFINLQFKRQQCGGITTGTEGLQAVRIISLFLMFPAIFQWVQPSHGDNLTVCFQAVGASV